MRERRYYMRVIERATTRYWGIALAVGLQLPAAAPPPVPPGNPVPAAATPAATTEAPFVSHWTVTLDGTSSRGATATTSEILVLSQAGDAPSGLQARDRRTGARTWTAATRGWETVAGYQDTVVGLANGRLEALDASTGRPRWSASFAGASPLLTLADEWLVVTSAAEIGAYGVRAGGEAWRRPLSASPSAPAALDPDAVIVGFTDQTLGSFALLSGQPRWSVGTGSPPSAVISDGTLVYAGLANGTLCAFRARDGRTQWCRPLGIPLAGRPLIVDGRLLVVLRDNTLRVFDRANGTMRDQRPLGFRPASGVETAGDRLVIPLASGAFLVLDRTGRPLATIAPPPTVAAAQLLGTVTDRDGQFLASLTIPAGGRLTLTAYRASGPASASPPSAPPPALAR